MYLSRIDKERILKSFPYFELCYEKIIHNKVFKDICIAIPKGKKCFAWFTLYKGKPICFFLHKDSKRNQIIDIEHYLCSFDEKLCLGTIVYGTFFEYKKQKIFSVEDIYYYKNKSIGGLFFHKKLEYLDQCFSLINQISYNYNFILFGLPLMEKNYKELMKEVNQVNYDIYSIQYRTLYKNEPYLNYILREERETKNVVFKVKAENQNDIYSLYCYDKGEKLYDTACVSNYKTSVFMNSLFRNIKENVNLDALEESDDENEFENIGEDKFVLNKVFYMDCKYNPKFKKWEPIKISKEKKMVSFRELKNI